MAEKETESFPTASTVKVDAKAKGKMPMSRIRKKYFPLTPASPPPASPSLPSSPRCIINPPTASTVKVDAKAKGKMPVKSAKGKMPMSRIRKKNFPAAQTHPPAAQTHPPAASDPCCHSYPYCLCGYPTYQPSPTSPPLQVCSQTSTTPPQSSCCSDPPLCCSDPPYSCCSYLPSYPAAAQPFAAWDIPWEIVEVEYVLEDSADESDDDDEENPKYPNYNGHSSSSSSSSPSTSSSQSTSSY